MSGTRSAIVTGASRGIGRATAVALARRGVARFALIARNATELAETARDVTAAGARALVVSCDLRSREAAEDAVRQSLAFVDGGVDVLVNAAGLWHDGGKKLQGPPYSATELDTVDAVMTTGVLATMRVTRLVLPAMLARPGSSVINVSCGFASPAEARGWVAYYVSNKAIDAFTAGLAAELRASAIRVNAVAPWYVRSEAVLRFYPDDAVTAIEPARVAEAICSLSDPACDLLSGQVIELRSPGDTV